jgi:hypothetical protein
MAEKEVLTKGGVGFVCKMFGVKDIAFVSKNQLLATFVKANIEIRRLKNEIHKLNVVQNMLTTELFCSNADHPIFENQSETVLAPLRIEKIKRHSGKLKE